MAMDGVAVGGTPVRDGAKRDDVLWIDGLAEGAGRGRTSETVGAAAAAAKKVNVEFTGAEAAMAGPCKSTSTEVGASAEV